MKPDGAACINCESCIGFALAPIDPASVEPRFGNYSNGTRREHAPHRLPADRIIIQQELAANCAIHDMHERNLIRRPSIMLCPQFSS